MVVCVCVCWWIFYARVRSPAVCVFFTTMTRTIIKWIEKPSSDVNGGSNKYDYRPSSTMATNRRKYIQLPHFHSTSNLINVLSLSFHRKCVVLQCRWKSFEQIFVCVFIQLHTASRTIHSNTQFSIALWSDTKIILAYGFRCDWNRCRRRHSHKMRQIMIFSCSLICFCLAAIKMQMCERQCAFESHTE